MVSTCSEVSNWALSLSEAKLTYLRRGLRWRSATACSGVSSAGALPAANFRLLMAGLGRTPSASEGVATLPDAVLEAGDGIGIPTATSRGLAERLPGCAGATRPVEGACA